MRVSKQIGGYRFSFCVEKANHLLPHNQSNQMFHIDFNIYKKGDEE